MSPLAPFVPNATIERAKRLEPIIACDAVVRRTLDRLREVLCGSSPRQAIAYLLESEAISEAELDELERLIETHRNRRQT